MPATREIISSTGFSLRRRQVLAGTALASLGMSVPFAGAATARPVFPYEQAAAIVARIRLPNIPQRDFLVQDFGASGDGRTDSSAAITRAIDACVAAGGGRIVFPQGTVLTGPIRLRSRMALHLLQGCTLKFIPEPSRYLPPVLTRWEGVELMGYHPLIYAFEESDIALTGGGVIDGGADEHHWWPWKGAGRYKSAPAAEVQAGDRERLFSMAERGAPVQERLFGEGSRLRPPLFQPYRCRNVLVDGLTINASPFWLLHPVECNSVTLRGVTCASQGPNNDGIDPESCVDVLIDCCTFNTGDDCIAIKAGRNADGRRLARPCENIVIRHCRMTDGHGGVAIGSEMTGGVRGVFVHDCTMDSPQLLWALTLKTNSYRGGEMSDIHFTRIRAGRINRAFIQVWLHYEEGDGGGHVPSVRHVTVSDSSARQVDRMLVVRGRPDSPVRSLVLSNVTVEQESRPSVVVDATDITVDNVTVGRKPWTRADIDKLPGLASISCDKWAVCR